MHQKQSIKARKRGAKRLAQALLGWGLYGLGLIAVVSANLRGEDWPQWRGSQRDGISREKGLLHEWPDGGPPLLWRAQGVGIGHSSMSISEGQLFTMGVFGDAESVFALDAVTGEALWTTPMGTSFPPGPGDPSGIDGPRSTPTVVGDHVYALGAKGDLSCLDASTGRTLWTLNVLSEFEAPNIIHGLSESPLVVGDLVLVNPGAEGASVVALTPAGTVLWCGRV